MRLPHRPLLPLVLLWLSAPAGAQTPEPSHPRELSLGVAAFGYMSFFRPLTVYTGLEASYRQPLAEEGPGSHLLVGGGLRLGRKLLRPELTPVRVPLEAFVEMRVRARLGSWEPTIGPELGVSGLSRLSSRPIPAEGTDEFEQSLVSPIYFGLSASPLRFRFGRFNVSALEIHLATASFPRNHVVRLYVGVLGGGFHL